MIFSTIVIDPIDGAIVNAFDGDSSAYKQTEIIGFNPSVKRVVAFVKHGQKTLTIAKGLPAKIIDTEDQVACIFERKGVSTLVA